MKSGLLRALLGALVLAGCAAPAPEPGPVEDAVPRVFRALYRELEAELDTLNPIRLEWDRGGDTVFGVELLVANGNRGEELLAPQVVPAAAMTLERLKELGARCVAVSIPYPVLSAAHPRTPEFREFYRGIAAAVRNRGLALVVELSTAFPEPELGRLKADHRGLTRERLGEGLREMAEAVVGEMRPDYLTLFTEPDTQQRNTGIKFSPSDFAATVARAARGLDRRGARLGAGAGTWSSSDYFKELAGVAELDYIDLHIYPIQMGFAAERAQKAAEIAQARGKRVTIGEAWLYKATGREFGRIPPVEVFARDAFSFWQPLDVRFIETVVRLARTVRADFCSFFWMNYLYGYVAYDAQTARMPPGELMRLSERRAAERILQGRPSDTGDRFRELTAR